MVEELKEPYCPYCFNGIIVKDIYGELFCNACFKSVKINIFNK